MCSIKTTQRFSSLAWGANGLLVGGMADGVVNVWDSASLLSGSDRATPTRVERFSTAVRAMQFNPNPSASALLAAASVDGDICVMQMENASKVTLASPLPNGQRLDSEITSLAWNTDVPHVLATATLAGVVVVWDLRENKPWCQLRDPHRASLADVCWHPSDGLYLVTACDDDSRPVLRVWDLRNSTNTPLCELMGHTKGVVSADWCPHDPNFILSCAKDSRTLVWDIRQGCAISEVPAASSSGAAGAPSRPAAGSSASAVFGGAAPGGGSMEFGGGVSAGAVFGAPAPGFGTGVSGFPGTDSAAAVFGNTLGGIGAGAGRRYNVRWSKQLPTIFSACSFDRRVTVHSAAAFGPGSAPKPAISQVPGAPTPAEAAMRRAPRWLRRPAGATFGFGGKLLSFAAPLAAHKNDLRAPPVAYPKVVQMCSVSVEPDFVSRAAQLQTNLSAIDAGAADVRLYVEQKAADCQAAQDGAAANVWTFMRLLFEQDARQRILMQLGYDAQDVTRELAKYTGRENQVVPLLPEENGGTVPGDAPSDAVENHVPHVDAYSEPVHAGQNSYMQPGHDAFSAASAGGPPSAAAVFGGAPSTQAGWQSAGDFFSASNRGGFSSAADVFASVASSGGDEHARATSDGGSAFLGSPHADAAAVDGLSPKAPAPAPAAATAAHAEQQQSERMVPEAADEPGVQFSRVRVPTADDNQKLKRALLIGDFAAAVAVCFKQGRYDDALLLASVGSRELFLATQDEYLRRKASPIATLVGSVIKGDLATLVETSALADWQETLGTLCTYAKVEEFGQLCEALGDRLALEMHDMQAAVIAYMCALAVNKVVTTWVHEARAKFSTVGQGAALLELVEKVFIFRHAVFMATGSPGPAGPQPEAESVCQLCSLLANESYLTIAAYFASKIADPQQTPEEVPNILGADMRYRLLLAFSRADYAAPTAQMLFDAPFPYPFVEVGIAPASASAPVHTGFAAATATQGYDAMQGGMQGAFDAAHAGSFAAGQPPHGFAGPQYDGSVAYGAHSAAGFQASHAGYGAAPAPAHVPQPSYGGYAGGPQQVGSVPAPATHAHAAHAQPYATPTQPHAAQVAARGPAGMPAHTTPYGGAPAVPVPTAQPMTYQPSIPAPVPPHAAPVAPPAPAPAPAYTTFTPTPSSAASGAHAAPGTFNPSTPAAGMTTAAPPAPAPAPAGPLPITPEFEAVLNALTTLISQLGTVQLTAVEQRQLTEAPAAVEKLKERYQAGKVTPDMLAKLSAIGAACAAYDFATANKVVLELAKGDFALIKEWHRGIRGLIALAFVKSGGAPM